MARYFDQDESDKVNGQYYGKDNPYNGSDDEDGGDLYESYTSYDIEAENEDNDEDDDW
ncbi:hypothetical protein [Myroides phaeus]|uniref:hypothetical protein n=1 Tax=Myroides phaeus TaxID=702745 RepID=UPI0013033E97|nr:hypothetical protein [Myroides phaeus]